ncbi:hypothetical protein ACFWU5_02770 [Nocardia sp. NPDC058640]|uniref:hypothetical protein n=1 Tax=Nocardia sp. NPDC058640 TaxID=3346571 RepID=UPI0036588104
MAPSGDDAVRLTVAAAMVFQVSAHARAGLRTAAQCFEEQARLLLADGESTHRARVAAAGARVESADADELAAAVTHRDNEILEADRRRQSLIAAIARHRLDEDTRARHHRATIDRFERSAQQMLIEAGRRDLCAYRPTVDSAGGVTVDELVAALELAVHDLRRRVDAYLRAAH